MIAPHPDLKRLGFMLHYEPEADRLIVLVRRDGLVATVEWARRTRNIYRVAVLDRGHHASTRFYRRGFIQSYLAFKRFVKDHHELAQELSK